MLILGASVLLIVICFAAGYFLLQDRVQELFTADPLPTLVPTAAPIEVAATGTVAPVEASVEEDQQWAQILAEGSLSIGTSADYPPFEYYTADLELTGLDIAIIEDIGRRLRLDVEIHDMAFEGLGNALQVNQIDVAISAISITPDRQQLMDFSNIYYVGADALLAGADSPLTTITNVEQLSGLRLGVQSETVYDSWAQSNLVETGIMPAGDLQRYQFTDDALVDLAAGRIDVLAMDLGPAQTAVALGGVKIIAQDLNSQRYAIAAQKGSSNLLAEINRVLFEMQGDGTLTRLIIDYMQLPEAEIQPLPTATPVPENQPPVPHTPTPFTGCVDSMEFVADLGSGAGSAPALAPGQSFRKGWQLRNTGTCAWNSEYALIPVDSNVPGVDLGGEPIVVTTLTQPGRTFDFWADLTAPTTGGTYVEYWSMINARNDRLFGDRVWAAVEVIPPPTVTPLPTIPPTPTQTPVVSISFSASPQEIQQGNCSTLTWSTQNVQAVYLYPQGQNWQDHGVVGSGSQSVCPSTTTTYELRVVLQDGSVVTRQASVNVISTTPPPTINTFTVTPAELNLGQCVTVDWAVSGSVTSVTILRNETLIWPNAPLSGSTSDCPPSAGDVPYRIDATGPGGTTRIQQFVRVVQP